MCLQWAVAEGLWRNSERVGMGIAVSDDDRYLMKSEEDKEVKLCDGGRGAFLRALGRFIVILLWDCGTENDYFVIFDSFKSLLPVFFVTVSLSYTFFYGIIALKRLS